MTLIDAEDIIRKQREWTASWHERPPALTAEGVMEIVQGNHLCNFKLWHQEDKARRDDRGHEFVYKAKRAIDRLNQSRNDYIERLDVYLQERLPAPAPDSRLHTETPGMIVDRLSILALKSYHMREQAERTDVDGDHIAACAAKLAAIEEQLSDLSRGLDRLVADLRNGQRTFRLYRQFKMYNDPKLNPELYRKT